MFPSQKSAVETRRKGRKVCFNGAGMFPSQKCAVAVSGRRGKVMASMGPGCFHPRNTSLRRSHRPLRHASMGPGCFHPRNQKWLTRQSEGEKLQWGRDVSDRKSVV